jgi:hypothetical protein
MFDGHGDPLWRSILIYTHLPPSAVSVWRSFLESPSRCNEVSPFPIHPHDSSHNRIQFVRRIRSEGEEITLVQFHRSEEGFWETSCYGLDNADETEAVPVEFFRRSITSEVRVYTRNKSLHKQCNSNQTKVRQQFLTLVFNATNLTCCLVHHCLLHQ